jgi:hypothetical protein
MRSLPRPPSFLGFWDLILGAFKFRLVMTASFTVGTDMGDLVGLGLNLDLTSSIIRAAAEDEHSPSRS